MGDYFTQKTSCEEQYIALGGRGSMPTTYVTKKIFCAASNDKESPEDEKMSASVERQLVRTTKLSTITMKLYRLVIVVRMGIFVLFFKWRISTARAVMSSPDTDATVRAMWMVSIAGELWFALMWVLDQVPKMQPVRRDVHITALDGSLLPSIDVFVTTADPEKEPPLVTANTILSVVAADYPADKVTCYVSDDGGSLLTRGAVAEAARFAGLWVPFCRKHGVEPRNPEAYFSPGDAASVHGGVKVRAVARGDYKGRAWPELARDWRRVRREYEELRLRIDALQAGDMRQQRWSLAGGNCWRRGMAEDHAGAVELLVGPPSRTPQLGGSVLDATNLLDLSSVDVRVPAVVYMCRQKRHGRAHHRKAGAMNALLRASAVLSNAPFVLNLDCDHYVNNSQAIRAGVCLMLDRGGRDVAFVQFPQRFDGVDPGDRYANHNRVFFDCTELGLDGLQGPIYVGTGCMFRRSALYGVDPPRWGPHSDAGEDVVGTETDTFGMSTPFLRSVRAVLNLNRSPDQRNATPPPCSFDGAAISEATALVSCSYEDGTAWGRDIGWMYGTVTEDVATGFCLHRRGWRSAYCTTAPDAFRGTAPINLADRLHQVLRWAAGSLEIFLSRNNAFRAGRLHPLQRVAYLSTTLYPLTSIFLILYCIFPAIPLLRSGKATAGALLYMGTPPSATYVAFLAALMLTLAMVAVLEVRWSGITLGEWWRNEQFWMVSATSVYLAAVLQVALKVVAGKEISFKLTSKKTAKTSYGAGVKERFAELYAVRWTVLMVPPAVVLAVNAASMATTIEGGQWRNGPGAVLTVAFNAWVVVHLYPFALGLMGRWSTTLSPLLLLVALFTVGLLCFVLQSHML